MTDLTARFSLIDEMSERIEAVARRGEEMLNMLEETESAASNAFSEIENGAAAATDSISAVADTAGTSSEALEDLADTIEDYTDKVDQSTTQADAWAETLEEQEALYDQCDQAMSTLARAVGEAAEEQRALSDIFDETSKTVEELTASEELSAEAQQAIAAASAEVTNAFIDLTAAQSEAEATMENFDYVITSETSTFEDLRIAAAEVTDAANNLTQAHERADTAVAAFNETVTANSESLQMQEAMFEICEEAAKSLSESIEDADEKHAALAQTIEDLNQQVENLADSEKVSTETKEELAQASTAAEQALQALTQAQADADAAMQSYDDIIISGTTDTEELATAARTAADAAERLAQANAQAEKATADLSDATQKAGDEAENAGKQGVDAIQAISRTLVGAAIVKELKDISEAAYELTEAFSEAESTVVKATGATGEALDSLMASTMDAYAASRTGTLDQTAAAVGELNTRMGVTGARLTELTEKFLDYSSITGSNVVTSVQNVTKVMNQWGVEASETESVLDKLAYAGQISGASVDNLSQTLITGAATFQNAGLSLDSTIKMLADFELAGINGTTAVTGLRTAVNKFSKEGLDANVALQETIAKIASMGDTSEATALAVETFGSRAGQQLALAIQNGTISVDTFNSSLEQANGTLEKTADAAQTLDEKWEQATNNVSAAFTTAIEPMISGTSERLAETVNNIGDFLNEHPRITKALTSIGFGLGVAVAALAAFTLTTKLAIPAIIDFGVALNAALGPIGWVTLGVTALAAAIAAFIVAGEEEIDVSDEMTETTREHAEELENLKAEYENVSATYGENSATAQSLAAAISDLETEYGSTARTIAEFRQELENTADAVKGIHDTYREAVDSSDDLYNSSTTLIGELLALQGQSGSTGANLDLMSGIVDKLNSSYGDLGLSIDETTGKLNMSAADLYEYISAANNEEKRKAAMEGLVEAIGQFDTAKEQSDIAVADLSKAADQYKGTTSKVEQELWNAAAVNAATALQTYGDLENQIREYCETLGYTEEETEAFIAQLEETGDVAENVASDIDEMTDATAGYEQAALDAFNSVYEEIEELCTAYDDAYNAALSSFEGQFGLFDEASTKTDEYLQSTVANAQAAVDSQLEYWNTYLANVEVLRATSAEQLGITQENYDALMTYVQDGSEQAAGLAASMVANINSGNEEAVAELANTVGQLQAKQQEASAFIADWQTDFNATMDELEERMNTAVDNMNLNEEAAAAAKSTIGGYIASIKASQGEAVAAAEAIANGVASALAAKPISVNVKVNQVPGTTIEANANGTTSSAGAFIAGEKGPELVARKAAAYAGGTTDTTDFYIAGENGPELIIGEPGSTVFPTSETNKIIGAIEKAQEYAGATIDNHSEIEYGSTIFNRPYTYITNAGDQNYSDDYITNAGDVSNYDSDYNYNYEKALKYVTSTENARNLEYTTDNGHSSAYTYITNAGDQNYSDDYITNAGDRNALTNYYGGEMDAEPKGFMQTALEFIANVFERLANFTQPEYDISDFDDNDRPRAFESDDYDDPAKEKPLFYLPPQEGDDGAAEAPQGKTLTTEEKRILLEIVGGGTIEIGNSDKESVLEVIEENLKPILMNLLNSEIYEEGELSYDF